MDWLQYILELPLNLLRVLVSIPSGIVYFFVSIFYGLSFL